MGFRGPFWDSWWAPPCAPASIFGSEMRQQPHPVVEPGTVILGTKYRQAGLVARHCGGWHAAALAARIGRRVGRARRASARL